MQADNLPLTMRQVNNRFLATNQGLKDWSTEDTELTEKSRANKFGAFRGQILEIKATPAFGGAK